MLKAYKYIRTPSRLIPCLASVAFIWILYLIKLQLDLPSLYVDKEYYLREKIVELSKEYVEAVARERSKEANSIDGQSVVELPDIKQATSVLLQNMLDRLKSLENQVENVVAQSAMDISELSKRVKSLNESLRSFAVNVSSLDTFAHECEIPTDPSYPECAAKVEWMTEYWRSDPKYSEHGVDGSVCSFLSYLSKVEKFCPVQDHASLKNESDCQLPPANSAFPNCLAKIGWMKSFWKLDPCYARDFGVNGTICSFLIYLSEVESWCPKLPGNHVVQSVQLADVGDRVSIKETSLEKLIDKLTHVVSEDRLNWIRTRIVRMYSYWNKALQSLQNRTNVTGKTMKKILIHIGVLAEEKRLHFAKTAGNGGPLGELVQWSDLITSLFVLGHDVQVTVEHSEMLRALSGGVQRSCPPKGGRYPKDVVFTDYYGLAHLRKKGKWLLHHYKCRLRIVDSFGTEAQFNYNGPLPSIGSPGDVFINPFGKNDLNLKQYMTMFPHSPDNTFLGFVVDSKDNVPESVTKKQQALAYGKHFYMWKDLKSRTFLDIIHENFEVHATTGGLPLKEVEKYLEPYIINHGVVAPGKLQNLLRKSKIFVGLGFPYEGPAPLEAIAQGCVFLNPKFKVPRNRENTAFFQGKPTFRALSSQHPYAEKFIGEPHVVTVDIDDPVAVREALRKIMDSKPSPYLPFEYTHEGMLERINALIHNQEFCNQGKQWPPLSSRKVLVGHPGESCKDVCHKEDLVCEPAYFESINNAKFFEKAKFPCTGSNDLQVRRSSLLAPAFIARENICVLQTVPALYSCTSTYPSAKRICPCRDYRKGQVALCKTCY